MLIINRKLSSVEVYVNIVIIVNLLVIILGVNRALKQQTMTCLYTINITLTYVGVKANIVIIAVIIIVSIIVIIVVNGALKQQTTC